MIIYYYYYYIIDCIIVLVFHLCVAIIGVAIMVFQIFIFLLSNYIWLVNSRDEHFFNRIIYILSFI